VSAFARLREERGELHLNCGCHGTQTLARIVDGQLIVTDRRHGETHQVRIPLDGLLDTAGQLQANRKP